MTIAFDLDGTITANPTIMLKLALVLRRGGAEVFVLTAAAGELPPERRPEEVKRRLNKLGFRDFSIVCCESADKPKICASRCVSVLIDDTPFKLANTMQLIPSP